MNIINVGLPYEVNRDLIPELKSISSIPISELNLELQIYCHLPSGQYFTESVQTISILHIKQTETDLFEQDFYSKSKDKSKKSIINNLSYKVIFLCLKSVEDSNRDEIIYKSWDSKDIQITLKDIQITLTKIKINK